MHFLTLIRSWLTRRNVIIAVVVLFGGLFILRLIGGGDDIVSDQTVVTEEKVKPARILEYGVWTPDSARAVLATVESTGDVDVKAEVEGTVEAVYVRVGDRVKKDQIIARFYEDEEPIQISYDNAVNTLRTTRLASENSIRSAEISLQTAEAQLRQALQTEGQNRQKVFDTLRIEARNSETVANNALDWADKILGASERFRSQLEFTLERIGDNDSVKKQRVLSEVRELVLEKDFLVELPSFRPTEMQYLRHAQDRLNFLDSIRQVVTDMDDLIRRTVASQYFSDADRVTYQGQAEALAAKVDTQLLALETKIEAAKSEQGRTDLAVVGYQNQIENARAALELARANGESQIQTAQSQYELARNGRVFLEVWATIDGIITAKEISPEDQVQANDVLFSIVSENVAPKVVAYLTQDETRRVRSADSVTLAFSQGQTVTVENAFVSFKTDPATQKVRAEFQLTDFPEEVLVGSFARVLVPTQNGKRNLLPITAISFEPDGAEVLILNADNEAERRKITYTKILGDSVEIDSSLNEGDMVLQYRNRAHAGEKIEPITMNNDQ